MNVPGHLASAYLLVARGETPRSLARLAPAWLGALLPDLLDKPAMWSGVTPYGRTVGHSLLLWAALLALWLLAGRARPRGWASSGLVLAGGISHLAVDLVDDVAEGLERSGYVFSAWLGWPLTNPDMWSVTSPHALEPMPFAVTALETATVAVCLLRVVRHRGHGPLPAR